MTELEVRIPDIGDAKDVEVIELCVDQGADINVDDALLVIESDKASMEVPSPGAGTLKAFAVELGDAVNTGDLVAVLEIENETVVVDRVPQERSVEAEPASRLTQDETAAPPTQPLETVRPAPEVPQSVNSLLIEVRIPDLEDQEGVVVIELLTKEGADIGDGDPLVVIESEKASMEIPSPVSGRVASLHVAIDEEVVSDSLIATIETTADLEDATDVKDSPEVSPEVERPDVQPRLDLSKQTDGASIYAGPAVRKQARELGVDLSLVRGSGTRGRIVKDDVSAYVKSELQRPKLGESGAALPGVDYPDFSQFGEVEEVPLTRVRQRGAVNLRASWLNVVHVTQHDEADVTELEAFRKQQNAQANDDDLSLTTLPFIVKCVVQALRDHPHFNASIHPSFETLYIKKYYHIGIAVDTEAGLVVPVVRDADQKNVRALAQEVGDLSLLARSRRLTAAQMQGASFTISNLGLLGGTGFTPIVNAPEVAILGVSKLVTKPVWENDGFVPRKVLPLSLSYDHRAINGVEGGRFLRHVIELLEDIRQLVL